MKVFIFALLTLSSCAIFRPDWYVKREHCKESITIYEKSEVKLKYRTVGLFIEKDMNHLIEKACSIDGQEVNGLIVEYYENRIKGTAIHFVW